MSGESMAGRFGLEPGGLMADPLTAEPFRQVALVVRDLDAAVRTWWHVFGVGPWTAYRLSPDVFSRTLYRGEEVPFGLRHALAVSGGVQLELVQPLEGPSIFAEHLEAHGEGLHHLGIYVADHAAAVSRALARGYEPLQSAHGFGAEGDGAFAYFAIEGVPAVVELISAPRVRRAPEFVYPPPLDDPDGNPGPSTSPNG
jgi:methylmalonyl-CoA/ethylmalonyl-CoA epimerase